MYNWGMAKFVPGVDGSQGGRKRLFIALAVISAVALCALLVAAWFVPYIGFGRIHPAIPAIMMTLFGLVILAILVGALILVWHIYTGKPCFGSRRVRGLTTKLLLPFMELVARCVGISPQQLRNSFIRVNNDLVLSSAKPIAPGKLLILLPHCLQLTTCTRRLTHNVDNCLRCGKCPIKDLLELRDRYGVELAIATGGTIARRIVLTKRPQAIVAVACERDLTSGIQDTYPIPVFGVLNLRPNGPCIDTLVDTGTVEAAITYFLNLSGSESGRAAR